MTLDCPLVVGAGVAGLSAATVLAEAGYFVTLVDQAPEIGGNIYRQPTAVFPPLRTPRSHKKRWFQIQSRFERVKDRIKFFPNHFFGGIDSDGVAFMASQDSQTGQLFRPSAVIYATGASERVLPRPGWTLPGVMTAGAIQTAMKASGQTHVGKTVLAGSGPLLFAVAAQLTRLGNPPVALIQAGKPLGRPFKAIQLPLDYLQEAAGYMLSLRLARVPIFYGSHIQNIREISPGGGLRVRVETGSGKVKDFACDTLGLHDGLTPNSTGQRDIAGVIIRSAGDCRDLDGARAAAIDGRAVGQVVAALLGSKSQDLKTNRRELNKHERAQAILADLFVNDGETRLGAMDGQTIVCRCENRTIDDLKSLSGATALETRLLGRFGMGDCQGRFCHETVKLLRSPSLTEADNDRPRTRLPMRAIPVRSLIDSHDFSQTNPTSGNT